MMFHRLNECEYECIRIILRYILRWNLQGMKQITISYLVSLIIKCTHKCDDDIYIITCTYIFTQVKMFETICFYQYEYNLILSSN